MLYASIHKDLTSYESKLPVVNITTRTFFCVVGAILISLLMNWYLTYVLGLDGPFVRILVGVSGLPLWCMGFLRPDGKKFEAWVPLYARFYYGKNNQLNYSNKPKLIQAGLLDASERTASSAWEKFATKQRGIELWDIPGEETDESLSTV